SPVGDKVAFLFKILAKHINSFMPKIEDFSDHEKRKILEILILRFNELSEEINMAFGTELTIDDLQDIADFRNLKEHIDQAKAKLKALDKKEKAEVETIRQAFTKAASSVSTAKILHEKRSAAV